MDESTPGALAPSAPQYTPLEFTGDGWAYFRRATLIPGAGHWVQQEAPGPCNEALEAFLRDL